MYAKPEPYKVARPGDAFGVQGRVRAAGACWWKYSQFKNSRNLVFNLVVNEHRRTIVRQHQVVTLEIPAETTGYKVLFPKQCLHSWGSYLFFKKLTW